LLRQLSGFESRHLSKIKSGRHKQRSSQHTLARQFFMNRAESTDTMERKSFSCHYLLSRVCSSHHFLSLQPTLSDCLIRFLPPMVPGIPLPPPPRLSGLIPPPLFHSGLSPVFCFINFYFRCRISPLPPPPQPALMSALKGFILSFNVFLAATLALLAISWHVAGFILANIFFLKT
jgi:hypothetical protein